MRKILSLALAMSIVSLSSASAISATQDDYKVIDRFLSETKRIIQLPTGTAVAVVKQNDIVYEGYFGFRDINERKPVTKDTVFYIASMTKAFFAQMILLKEQQGLLDTSWTLQQLFPKTNFIPALKSDQVTIKHLLGHTAGIDNWPLVQATAYTGLHNKPLINQIIAESYVNAEGAFGQFAYTNVGYNLLSHWMDSSWETRWQDELASSLFVPLGMKHTSAYMSDARRNQWPLAKGYSVKSPVPHEALSLTKIDSSMQSAGGMISTATDIAKFLMAQINHGSLQGKQLLSKAAVKKSQESLVSFDYYGMDREYAYGWFIKERNGNTLYEHRGGYAGASTYMSFIPEHKVGLVVLSNQDKWGGDLAFALEDIAYAIALGKPEAEINSLVQENLEYASKNAANFYANKPHRASRVVGDIAQQYLGKFSHHLLGEIKVNKTPDSEVVLEWGNLKSQLFVDDGKNQLMIEFIPNNMEEIVMAKTFTGDVLLEYAGYQFVKEDKASELQVSSQ